jgi:hypothetical protein
MSLHVEKRMIAKASGAVAQTVVWGGLALTAMAAFVYDVSHWVQSW